MRQESKEEEHLQKKAKPASSTEELRTRTKEVLEKANQVLKESGKPKGFETGIQGETTE